LVRRLERAISQKTPRSEDFSSIERWADLFLKGIVEGSKPEVRKKKGKGWDSALGCPSLVEASGRNNKGSKP